ncbi:nucleotidyltransferase domain-containing protein [Nocardiopsis akebiae]|uniref:Nucleotidyltransferase domain-containing protein n=1 Tax=Nocardiopsis akebiae TaxID=2831968 RepID=A0ABX8CAF3_9ACTN|nr:nucleotidyltransferase domain-containing protein [Nocardiopsis akebiae]QUX31415.1 nucleotidyltransferase domain-containing protein [Nocardiopsis akebiae]
MPPDTERDRLRERLLARAGTDDSVVGAALTGSSADGTADRWSDIDLVLAVREGRDGVPADWTEWLHREFGALHHWDLPVPGPRLVRVFLLPGCLEVDLAFLPEGEFGPRGPQWRTVFGKARELQPFPEPDPDTLIGHSWHHALHARVCVERGRLWQAEHWIGRLREQTVALACLRLGSPTAFNKGAHLLPAEVTDPLGATLVRALTGEELLRALEALTALLITEVAWVRPELADALGPELGRASSDGGR